MAVGFNNIDVAYARSRGVAVTNTPDVLTDSVADFTWALILAVTRRLAEGDRLVRRGGWKGWAFDFMLGTELRGKQLGLIGVGRIGRAVAARAAAFGVRVAYTSRRPIDFPDAEAMSFDRLLTTSDIVSLHVPLTPETRHLIDRKALARMRRSAYLVNTARGPVVDEAALAWALGGGSDCRRGARRLRRRAHRPSRSAASRERAARAPSGKRHHRNADGHGRSRRQQRDRGAAGRRRRSRRLSYEIRRRPRAGCQAEAVERRSLARAT